MKVKTYQRRRREVVNMEPSNKRWRPEPQRFDIKTVQYLESFSAYLERTKVPSLPCTRQTFR